jgi:hypothetical protein
MQTLARKTGKTSNNCWYGITQDAPNSIHISVNFGEMVLYEQFSDITSEEQLTGHIERMAREINPPHSLDDGAPDEKL